jgi:hypothetical protein
MNNCKMFTLMRTNSLKKELKQRVLHNSYWSYRGQYWKGKQNKILKEKLKETEKSFTVSGQEETIYSVNFKKVVYFSSMGKIVHNYETV